MPAARIIPFKSLTLHFVYLRRKKAAQHRGIVQVLQKPLILSSKSCSIIIYPGRNCNRLKEFQRNRDRKKPENHNGFQAVYVKLDCAVQQIPLGDEAIFHKSEGFISLKKPDSETKVRLFLVREAGLEPARA